MIFMSGNFLKSMKDLELNNIDINKTLKYIMKSSDKFATKKSEQATHKIIERS